MAKKWEKWIQKERGSKLIGGFLMLAAAVVFIHHRLTQDVVRTKDDLKFVKGQLDNFRFTRGTRGYRSYDFWLLHHPILYRIDADFLTFFDEDGFRKLNYGDTLTIALSKEKYNQISGQQFQKLPSYILVYSIANDTKTFLDCDKAIQKHNSSFPFYAAVGFFLAGVTMIYLLYRHAKKRFY
jgi:hypothetical protein